MSLKKFKRILSQVVIVMVMIPNFSVKALENNSIINVGSEASGDTISKENGEENIQNKIVEDTVVDNTVSEDTIDEAEVKYTEENVLIDEVVNDGDELQVEENNKKSSVIDVEVLEKSLVGQVYKSKEVDIQYIDTNIEEYSERIEYKLKMEALSKIKILETKTTEEYEVALAHEDGSFTYVSSQDTIEAALDQVEILSEQLSKDPQGTVDKLTNMSSGTSISSIKIKNLSTATSDSSALATIIDKNGQVVYSTNAMARIIKYINGSPYMSADKTINLYSNSSLANVTGYINHMYVDDAPILEDAGNSAKILVGSTEAWINKNTSSSEYDMIVVPLNQVKNPSYYMVQNGELRHYISSDITGASGYTITIGKAPSYLTTGVRYFSYDGIYFYDGQNIQLGLDTLINDYKSGSRGKSVNGGNPFYLYYNYLPFRSKTVYTANELNNFINANTDTNSKLRGLGLTLKDVEQSYGVNSILTLGIAMNESALGMSTIAQTKNNLFGINAVDSNPGETANEFSSPSASVIEFTKNYISRGYADPADWRYNGGFLGNKNLGANVRYASDPFWGEKAASYAFRIDLYLSGGVNSLIDTDSYQLALYNQRNQVKDSSGVVLYAIDDYWSFVGTTFILVKDTPVSVSGTTAYEIYPERTTEATLGKFQGDYDWNKRGYINTDGITLINIAKANQKNGWMQESGKWYYYENGHKQTGLVYINGERYYLDSDGARQVGWQTIGQYRYYFKIDGQAIRNQWFVQSDKIYRMNENGVMLTGFQYIGRERYYLGTDGVRRTGWQTIGSYRYYFRINGQAVRNQWFVQNDKIYYLNSNGVMLKSMQIINGQKYYLGTDGARKIGWQTIGSYRYYFKSNGQAIRNEWFVQNGKIYRMNQNGVMLRAWQTIDNKRYYFGNDGVRVTGWQNIDGQNYYFDKYGVLK